MSRANAVFTAVFPFIMALVCGFHLRDLTEALDTGRGIHSATDLYVWIIVPVSGAAAAVGARRAYRAARN